jgi:beta-galactosidase
MIIKKVLMPIKIVLAIIILLNGPNSFAQQTTINFNNDWKFFLGNDSTASNPNYNDGKWRSLNVPHDWSIEGEFSKEHPTTFNQGALPAGIGWYRKTFSVPVSAKDKVVSINFDGVYHNREVWINGHYLGKRPNGYISFQYDLSPHLKYGKEQNVIAVKVDNSLQPNSRWYTGSGIYRKVWLTITNSTFIDPNDFFIHTSSANSNSAIVKIRANIRNYVGHQVSVKVRRTIYTADASLNDTSTYQTVLMNLGGRISEEVKINNPILWSVESPNLYKIKIEILSVSGYKIDEYETTFGIRSFHFDAAKGFFLNNKPLKILGVCNHHDLGALGSAFNIRAAERQLEILKAMGCNAIRTAHNPPAPELLDLCDRMGFLVMDEAFDMWKKRKNRFDYNVDFNEWHKKDLEDMIKRDRNHPSIIAWSIGNEIREQFDSTGITITKELVDIVKALDPTRPVTCALTENIPEKNFIYQSKALDVLGFNYKLNAYPDLPKRFPGQKFIATETASALATRGYYEMPSDSNRLWPPDSKSKKHGNADGTVSAYDNTYAYWGASHEESWNAVKKYDFISGVFVWAGFDFLGEPVPYEWPSRSSYYGIIDLAGFPKDVYYMYQSEWTTKPVLHIFPHWNWKEGQEIDVWAYYNHADEVELFLNGQSLGKKSKQGDTLHIMWRVKYQPGTLKAVSRKNGKTILIKEIETAGVPAKIQLIADRKTITANGEDLSFITVNVLDKEGNLVPDADNLIQFEIKGPGFIAGVDNGNPVSMESFKASNRKAFHGKCLLIVQSKKQKGQVTITASSKNLVSAFISLQIN